MKRHWQSLACSLTLAALVSGCSGEGNPGVIPASKDAKSTHDAIENPAGIKDKGAPAKKKANDLPPQPPK